jgi:hypothetical protein
LQKLEGGDRRSIGRADEVVADVLEDPALFDPLFQGVYSDDPLIRMRAADAVEKISVKRPNYLQSYKGDLLQMVSQIEQQEVRWHLAQMIPRLDLTAAERRTALEIFIDYLDDESKIVKTFSMQAMADLTLQDPGLGPQVIPVLEQLTMTGSPAMRGRGRKLLKQFERAA